MNLKTALPTITVILAVIAPGFLAVGAAIDNVSLNARARAGSWRWARPNLGSNPSGSATVRFRFSELESRAKFPKKNGQFFCPGRRLFVSERKL